MTRLYLLAALGRARDRSVEDLAAGPCAGGADSFRKMCRWAGSGVDGGRRCCAARRGSAVAPVGVGLEAAAAAAAAAAVEAAAVEAAAAAAEPAVGCRCDPGCGAG